MSSVRMIIWNSLRDKYAERRKDFSPPQVKVFFKNWEAFFAFCDEFLGVNNISFDDSMQWVSEIWI